MFRSVIRKTISIVLVLAMFSEVSAPLAFAVGLQSDNNGYPTVFEPYGENEEKEEQQVCVTDETIAFENTDRRDVNTKDYRLTDGSNAVFLYPIDVHEKNADGNWIEIDNQLKLTENKTGENVYSASRMEAVTELYEKPEPGKFLKLTTNDGSISWGFTSEGVNDATAKYTQPLVREGESKLQLKSISGVLSYSEVLPGVRLDFQLLGKIVEEGIYLESRQAAETAAEGLSYSLVLKGYRAELSENTILIMADGAEDPVYTITAPFMEDGAGEESASIDLSLQPLEELGAYSVKILPDSEWLLSEERVYPIVIDPTITQFTRTIALDTCSVYSADPGDNLYNYGWLLTGREASAYESLRACVRFDLPSTITESDMVIDASLMLTQLGFEPSNSAWPCWINAYPITGNWPMYIINWYVIDADLDNSYTRDNRITGPSDNGTRSVWDITALVKEWYRENNNYGLALCAQNEYTVYRYVKYCSAHYPNISQWQLPIVQITYLNQEGLEDYLTYHSAGGSSMGVVSVGDFNGNLIYAYDDIAISGGYIPLSIQHVFSHNKRTNADLAGSSMHYGLGFRLNLSQRIESTSIDGYPYKLIDADGTEHYFTLKGGTLGAVNSVYEKEFDTKVTLTITGSGYALDYCSDLKYNFDTAGRLVSIYDTVSGKTQTLTYTSGKLTSVTDGSGRTAMLSYDSSGYLTSITDPSGRSTTYTYSDGSLTRITSPDGLCVQFFYTNGMLTHIADIDSSGLDIEYYPNHPNRVKCITEKGSSGGEGGKLSWAYAGGSTTITDRSGLSQTYMFDNVGHTVCIKDGEGNAYFGSYINTDDNNKHSLKLSSDLQGTVRNYLVNHSFEQSSYSPWSEISIVNGTGSIGLTSADTYLGARAFEIYSDYIYSSGYGIAQTVNSTDIPGNYVTLSAMVKAGSFTPTYSSFSGVQLLIIYKNASGSKVYKTQEVPVSSSEWQRVYYSVKIPDSASTELQCGVVITLATGTIYVDSIQLESGPVASRYNMLENAGFRESVGSTSVSGWSGSSTDSSSDKVTAGRDGNGFTLAGDTNYAKALIQTIPASGSLGDRYVFAGWGKANALCRIDKNTGNERNFGLFVRFKKADGTYEEKSIMFEAKCADWQYLSSEAVAPCSYVELQFGVMYYHQKNYAIFDDLQLYREGFGASLERDAAGRIVSSTDSMGRTTSYTYAFSGRDEISSITYPDSTQSTFTYDQNTHQLLTSTDANGKTVTYHHDGYGNTLKVTMSGANETLVSGEKTIGTAGYTSSSEDSLGNVTQYSYNTNKGLLASVTSPNLSLTTYTYNTGNDLLTKIENGDSSVEYTYTNRMLTGVSHSVDSQTSVNYSLLHDQFGNRTETKVGTQSLASYTYATNNGELTQTTYGDGTYVSPIYDQQKRKTALYVNGIPKFRWHYGTDGRVWLEEDLVNSVKWRYVYNTAGNITQVLGDNGENTFYDYSDLTGKILKTRFTYGGLHSSTEYEYSNAGLLQSIKYAGNSSVGTLDYSYDVFERASKTFTTSASASLTSSCEYIGDSDAGTTTLVPNYLHLTGNSWSIDYQYRYDTNGRINRVLRKQINPSNYEFSYTGISRFIYDDLGQLVRENNNDEYVTYLIEYDDGGNILQVDEYEWTNSTPIFHLATHTYGYSDPNWKDKLTSYDGQTITYDAIGNPLTYRDGISFTWQNGRQLYQIANNGVYAMYRYNSSGIRTAKTVGTTVTEYTLSGDKVIKATTGQTDTLYYYDADGFPAAFRIISGNTTADYYYIKGYLGDVVAIADASGNIVVEYAYNAWGKIYSIEGSKADTIGQSNPYRYKGYWYDTETGLYYLQSRYYDPITGRFINADGLISTGTGVLGCNMFAYCNNNPIMCLDSEGVYPVFDLTIIDYAIIHKDVQKEICNEHPGFVMEVYVKDDKGKRGFLDLYDTGNNEYYEVKSYNVYTSNDYVDQMTRYDSSVIQDSRGNKRKGVDSSNSYSRGENKDIKGSFIYGVYEIAYNYQEPGVITYTVVKSQQLVDQARQRMAAIDAFWVSILTGGLMSGFDDPVIVY